MVLKGPHKTTEVATKDTEMGWRCDSKEERSKNSNKNRYGHGFIFNTRSETEGFEIQTKDKRTPPKSKIACVAAGPRTRLNPLYSPEYIYVYTEGLERLRRRLSQRGPQ